MDQTPNAKSYDLEERTFQFAKRCRALVKNLPRTVCNLEDGKQLIRSSGSVAANYIEANESLSRKDFALRVKISRKEAKESRMWLRLIDGTHGKLEEERLSLMAEADELCKILSTIVAKVR